MSTPSSFTVVADPSGRLLQLLVTGEIGLPDAAVGVRDTLIDIGLSESREPVLVDLRQAVLAPGPDALARLRERVLRWTRLGIPSRRIALVGGREQSLALAWLLAEVLMTQGYPARVFADDGVATAWLDGPPEG